MSLHDLSVVQLANGGIGSVRLELALRQSGASVVLAADAMDVLTHLEGDDLSVGVVDVDIPDIPDEFFEALRNMRADDNDLRLLGCGSTTTSDRIAALLGNTLDDFVLRPIDADEIAIRLKLLIDGGQTSTSTVLQEGDLKLDIVNRDVLIGDEPVSLTARERSVLQMLMRDSGMAISKTILAGRISTMEEEIAPQTVETYIHGLRKKLKDSVVDIHTVRGAGYLLKES